MMGHMMLNELIVMSMLMVIVMNYDDGDSDVYELVDYLYHSITL